MEGVKKCFQTLSLRRARIFEGIVGGELDEEVVKRPENTCTGILFLLINSRF